MVRTRQSTLLQDCFTANLRLYRLPRLENSSQVSRCRGVTRLVVDGGEDIPDYRLRTKRGEMFLCCGGGYSDVPTGSRSVGCSGGGGSW